MGTDKNLRQMACDVLFEVLEEGQFIHVSLPAMLRKYQYLTKQERAFLTRLCEGTVEEKIFLDYRIDQLSKTKVSKMKPQIRTILRMGAYQILRMDAVPDAAAVNEAVKLAAGKGFQGLKGFVNGVLRNLARQKESLPFPKEPAAYLSVKYSMPEWLVRYDLAWLGREKTEAFYQASSLVPELHVCVNTHKTTEEALAKRLKEQGVTYVSDDGELCGGILRDLDHLEALESFREGEFFVQDLSSALAVKAAGIQEGDLVLDVCSAPGGKAMAAALAAGEKGLVIARDLTEEKVEKIRENAERLGLANVQAQVQDARVPDDEMLGRADVVIADLPCSGLGVLRRKSDIKYHVTEESIRELVHLQREILRTVVSYVKPGGTLLYSTCTVTKEENDDNTDWIRTLPGFCEVTRKQIFPSAKCDGFYYAVFRRNEDQ